MEVLFLLLPVTLSLAPGSMTTNTAFPRVLRNHNASEKHLIGQKVSKLMRLYQNYTNYNGALIAHTHLHTLTHTCPHTRCVTSPSDPNFSTHGSGHPHRTCCVITPASGSVKLAEWQLFSHFIDGDANAPGSELTCWSRSHGVTLPCPFLTLENMGQAGGA